MIIFEPTQEPVTILARVDPDRVLIRFRDGDTGTAWLDSLVAKDGWDEIKAALDRAGQAFGDWDDFARYLRRHRLTRDRQPFTGIYRHGERVGHYRIVGSYTVLELDT